MSADRDNSSARGDNDLDDVWRAAAALLEALERSCRRCTHVHMDAPVADPTVGFLIENERGLYAVMGPANDLENLLRDVPKTGTGNDDLIRQLRELFRWSIGIDFRVGGRVNAHQLFALREATEKAGKDDPLASNRADDSRLGRNVNREEETPPRRGGRPSLSKSEARKREALVERWKRAQAEGVRQKAFCRDASVTMKHLTRCINWCTQRGRRNAS